jgi:hypothetical protein
MRNTAAAIAVCGIALLTAAGAFAAPSGAKNASTFLATCDNGLTAPIVVNNANGRGSGTENRGIQAEWAPAHVVGSNLVFHPASFDLQFSFFDAASGQTFTDSQVADRKNGKIATTCELSGTQTDDAGDTFTISGTVGGWLS